MENVELLNCFGWSILGGGFVVLKLFCLDNRIQSYRFRFSRDLDLSCLIFGGVGIS